jgi:hypothetical protein
LSSPIWIRGGRLWVTDIDVVWIFDLKSKKGRKLALPGVGFANDPALAGNTLYISDNRNDKLVKVEPADFLNAKNPARDGMLYMVGFLAADKPRAIYALGVSGQISSCPSRSAASTASTR